MNRRHFISMFGGAATAWPLAAHAQQPMPVIGFLNSASAWEYAHLIAAFRQGMSETGYAEGRNVLVEYRWAEGHYERLPTLAADLVRRQVAVIVAPNVASTLAAKAATMAIPIVFAAAVDPVEAGLVATLSRPGGNLTGVSTLNVELGPKRLDLLHKLVPTAAIIAALLNPTNPSAETQSRDLQAAARVLGLQLHILHASTERDFDPAFARMAQLRARALVVGGDAFFNTDNEQLARLTLHHAMPTIFQYREFAAAGGLLSYGGSIKDVYRLVGSYAGRILKGEKPSDLPVQHSTKAELIINLNTAKVFGLTVPLPLLGRADEVIE